MRRLELAERVIELRERAGLTQGEAAKKAGVGVTTWSNIETGAITRPHARTVIKIARALGVDPEEIAAPKAGAPPSSEPEKVSEEQRRLAGYVRPWLLLADSYSERWEKAAAKGTFTMDAYMEFGATTRDIFKAVDWLSRYLERVQGLDPTAGPIGFALRESMMRLARTMGLVSESALSIFGSNELSKARKQRPEVYSEIEEFLKKEAL